MAVGQGFSKAVTSGSVFWYDAGDMINSFKGKPGTNSLNGVTRNYDGYSLTTYSNGKLFETNGYTEVTNIPALGNRTVESIEIYNVYSGYGDDGNFNCCPNLFRYSLTGWNGTQLSGSTLYMYEIVYKCASGYTHPNFMYHYETRADGTYNTEYGVFDTSRQISLGDGWYYGWGEFTTQATTAQGYFGLWYYNYNVRDKVSIASISLQQGNSVLPPRQLIPGSTTRTATQSLIDIVGNTTVDVSNVTFGSTGELVFDATNDYISLGSIASSGNNARSIFAMIKSTSLGGYCILSTGTPSNGNAFNIVTYGSGKIGVMGYNNDFYPSSGANVFDGRWHYIGAVYDGSGTITTYVDGQVDNVGSMTYNTTGQSNFVGKSNHDAYPAYWNGSIDVVQTYNRALTAGEIRQNYNHYKTRFNLP